MDNQKKAYIYALSAVALWSSVATAFKISLKYLDYLELLLFSSFFSLCALFIILVCQKKLKLLINLSAKEYLKSALLGFLNPFLYYIILFKAYSLLPAQEAQTLNYTWAVMVVILSVPLLKQKISKLSIIAILISFFGALLIACKGEFSGFHFSNTLGVALAVGSSLIWAMFWILNMKDKREEVVKLFLNFVFGFLFILILNLSIGEIAINSLEGIASAAYVGLFEMGITFVFWLKAIQLSKTTAKVSSLIYLSPFISLIFINFVLNEKIHGATIAGLAFIIGGIFLQRFGRRV